jgi:Macrocin-O-methyltransferase (TylF)
MDIRMDTKEGRSYFSSISARSTAERYLRLMKACLAGVVNEDPGIPFARSSTEAGIRYDECRRKIGGDLPLTALTMAGTERLNTLRWIVESVLDEGVPGDLFEAGVWRGGASMLMKAVLQAYDVQDRYVWLADSFEGMPTPNLEAYPIDAEWETWAGKIAVPLESVRANFARYRLLDDRVRFLKGWFRDTLPAAPIERLAVLRMDGDLYESTMDILNALYHRVSPGGFVIIDDYMWASCRRAVHEFRERHGIHEEIVNGDRAGAYWRVR